MAVLDLTRCPICHARDSLARQTTQLESRTHVTYECRACGTLLAWLGDEMWLEADRWSFQKVGRPEQADLLYRSMTVAELRKLAGEKPPAAPVGVGKDARPAKSPPVWIDIPPARVEPPPAEIEPPVPVQEPPPVVEVIPTAKTEEPLPLDAAPAAEIEPPVEAAPPAAIEPAATKTDAPRLVKEPPAGEVAPAAEIEPPLEVAPMVTPRPRAQGRRGKQRDRRAAVGQAGRSGAGAGRRRSRGSPFLVLSVAAVLLCLICSAATMIIYSLVGNWPLQGVPPTDPPTVEALATDTPVPTDTPIPTDTPVPTETAVPTDAAAPPETAGAPGGPDGVEFQGVTDYLSGSGSHYLVGEVLNRTADTLRFVEISATFYDASGQVVGGGSTFTELNSVEPGSAAPFKLTTLNPPAFERYDLQVDYATTTQPPVGLEVAGHSGSLGADGWYRVVGEVRNPHDFAVKFPEIVVTCYNGAHQVIRVEANLAQVNPLEPGQSSPFEVVLTDPPADLQHYALQAEAVQQ
jgi:hypothetical protein